MKRILIFLVALLMMAALCTACDHHHTYDSSCDKTCNECNETRSIQHSYSDDTDLYCNVCNHLRLAETWTTTIEGDTGNITLKADGTGTIAIKEHLRPCTWVVEDNTLTVVQDVEGFSYTLMDRFTFSFSENSLVVTSPKGNTRILTMV